MLVGHIESISESRAKVEGDLGGKGTNGRLSGYLDGGRKLLKRPLRAKGVVVFFVKLIELRPLNGQTHFIAYLLSRWLSTVCDPSFYY